MSVTTSLQSDTRGLWWVYCEQCDRTLGDPVPYEMAEAKQAAHEAQHEEAS